MADFGGMGGLTDRREIDEVNEFEATMARIFGEKMRQDQQLCIDIWSALANVEWYHPQHHHTASYSFRAAGDLIAAILADGNYMDWYCAGPEGVVSEFIRRSMKKEGWIYDDSSAICDEPGCLNDVSCGWPSPDGYRMTCFDHGKNAFS